MKNIFLVSTFILFFLLTNYAYIGTDTLTYNENARYFDSRSELVQFLNYDQTDMNYYDILFDCEKFAITLQDNALKHGYIINVVILTGQEYKKYFEGNMSDVTLHAICGTVCKTNVNGFEYVYIEPQNDFVKYVGVLD